jgi:hypothetical protein
MIAFSNLRRAVVFAAATALAAIGVVAANPASAVASTAVPGHVGLSLRRVQVSASSLSPQLRSRLTRSGAHPDSGYIAWEIVNAADGKCLDANNAGPSAGANGDKVQLWTCNNTSNQLWEAVDWEDFGSAYTIMVNVQYQSKCLNADNAGGLANGHRVQLWDCVGTTNDVWDFGDLVDQTLNYLYLNSTGFVLDADAAHLGNGDKVQIWRSGGGANQLWGAN